MVLCPLNVTAHFTAIVQTVLAQFLFSSFHMNLKYKAMKSISLHGDSSL